MRPSRRRPSFPTLVSAVLLGLLASPASAGLNTWTTGGPPGRPIRDLVVDPAGGTTAYAGTDTGVYRTTNGGATWTAVSGGLTLLDIKALAISPVPGSLYCGTNGRGVFKFDGNANWTPFNSGLPVNVAIQALATHGSTVVAATSSSIYRSTDDGLTWNLSTPSNGTTHIVIQRADPTRVFANSPNGLLRSTDGGGSFNTITAGLNGVGVSLVAVHPTDASIVYLTQRSGLNGGGLYKSTDGGLFFAPVSISSVVPTGLVVDPAAPANIYYSSTSSVVSSVPSVFQSTDGGQSWTSMSTGLSPAPVTGLAIGPTGTLLYVGTATTTDTGNGVWNFQIQPQPAPVLSSISPANRLQHSGAFSLTATGSGFTSLSRVFWGGQSRPTVFNSANQLTASIPGTDVADVGNQDVTVETPPPGGGQSSPKTFAVLANPNVWTSNGLGIPTPVQALTSGSSVGHRIVYAGTAAVGVYRSDVDGTSWVPKSSGITTPNVKALYGLASDWVLAGTTGGGAFFTNDHGESWTPRNNGLSSPNVRAFTETLGNVWAGTASGVFRSTNYGQVWTSATNALPNVDVRALAARSLSFGDALVILAGTGSGAFLTTDGGVSWLPRNNGLTNTDIRALVWDSGRGVYAATAAGVFRSGDDAQTWTPLISGLTNLDVRALAVAVSDGTVYAGTAGGGVFRSLGGVNTWTPLNNGLGNLSVLSLCFSNAYGVLHAGTSGGTVYDMVIDTVGLPTDLTLTMTDAPDPINVAELVTYTITVNNNGPNDAEGTAVNDPLPAGSQLVFATSSQGSCSGTSSVACLLGTVPNGGSATVTIQVRALTAGTLTNTASVSAGASDTNPGDNQATVTTTVNNPSASTADLSVSITDSPDPAGIGASILYTITVQNAGPGSSTNVVVQGQLAPGLSFLSSNASQGSCVGTDCNLGTLASGGSATVSVVASAAAAGSYATSASAYGNASDPATANNLATTTTLVAVPGADLSISMSDSPDPVAPGSNLTYAITVANGGIDAASSTTVTDALPAGAAFVSATASSGSCSGTTTVTCNLLDVPAGATRTVTIVVKPGSPGTLSNTATVSSTINDPNPGNNSASTSTQVTNPPAGNADLSVSMTDAPDPVGVGALLTYTITVSNGGPSTATGVTVADTLPAGVALVSAIPSQGTCTGASPVSCVLGSLASGNSATVIVKVTTGGAGTITNDVQVTGDQTDSASGNNTASVTTTVIDAPDLVLTMVDAPDPVAVGGLLTYTLTVRNAGNADGTLVTLTDTLPATVTPGTATPSQGTCGGLPNLSCDLGTIGPGATVTVSVTVTPNAAGILTNTASVVAAESDVNLADNTAFARTTVNGVPSDLFLLKSHTGNFTVGTNGTFTLTVSNVGAGPSAPSAPIAIGSVTNARFGSDWTLNGPRMANTRAKLLDPANFGPGGRVGRAITIDDTGLAPGSITPALLAGYDAFFVGYLQDAAVNTFTASELAAFRAYAEDGGTLIVTCDNFDHDNVCNQLGYPVMATLRSENPYAPTPAAAGHPAFNGPFGVVSSFSGSQTIGYFFDSNGLTVLARDPQGIPVLAEKTYGQGRVVFLTDVDFLATTASAGSGITNANDRLIGNLFAWAANAGVVTVTDTLPAGLTFVSGGGPGWSCSAIGAVVTCTGSGPIAPATSSSFPLTVAVGAAAVPSVTNTAVVSVSGDGNPENDTAIDTVAVGTTPIAVPVPSVNAVVPSSGPAAGGTAITVYGSNFAVGAALKLNAATAPVGTTLPTSLAAVTPAGAPGPASVTVTNPDGGTFTRAGLFTYLASVAGPTSFYTVTPCRAVDTRSADGPLGGPILAPGATRTFPIGGTCGIPADAVALSVNLTVTGGTASGYLKVFGAGQGEPLTSSINFAAGQTRANNGIFTLGGGGLNVQAGTTAPVHVIVDVNGYFK